MTGIKPRFATLGFGLALLSQIHSQSFLTDGLVAYYPFNGDARDAAGTNDGLIIGSDFVFGPGRFGAPQSGLFLNGALAPSFVGGTYVLLPRPAALDFDRGITISLWFMFTNDAPLDAFDWGGHTHDLISSGPETSGVHLRWVTDDETPPTWECCQDWLQFLFWKGLNITRVESVRHRWFQITVVKTKVQSTSIYMGGRFRTGGSGGGLVDYPNFPNIWIGRNPSTLTYPVVGATQDIRFYNRALSTDEVWQLYLFESALRVGLVMGTNSARPLFSNLYIGTNYQLQVSADLNTWTDHGNWFTATNTTTAYPELFDPGVSDQLFFRLRTYP